MATATTTEAGRAVALGRQGVTISTGAERVLEAKERARKAAEAKRAAAELNGSAEGVTRETPSAPAAEGVTRETPSAPSTPAQARPSRPATLAEAAPWLLKPFKQCDIEIKPSATTKDKARGLVAPYADMRVYQARLDKIVGVENWSHTITLAERGAVCSLTVFGVTKSAAGDYPIDVPGRPPEENKATSAEAQAFKRACAAFGLGRYLYQMPELWGALDDSGKRFVDPAGLIKKLYDSIDTKEEK